MPGQTFEEIPRIRGDFRISLHQHVGKRTNDGGERRLATRHQFRRYRCGRSATGVGWLRRGGCRRMLRNRAKITENPLRTLAEYFAFAKIVDVLRDHAYGFVDIGRRSARALDRGDGVRAEIGQQGAREFGKNGRVNFVSVRLGTCSIAGVQCVLIHRMRCWRLVGVGFAC